MEELNKAIRHALASRFGVRQTLEDDTLLFSSGLPVDSLNVIDLVSLIEEQLGCAIPPAEITLKNFDSVGRIVRFASTLEADAK